MQIAIANGTLTTEHESASFSKPVFIFGDVAYGPDSLISGAGNAGDIVAKAYSQNADEERRFSVAEYNMIARFAGLPLANYCSGE